MDGGGRRTARDPSGGAQPRLRHPPLRPPSAPARSRPRDDQPRTPVTTVRHRRSPQRDHTELRIHRGLPVTSPARTLLDLAANRPAAEIARAAANAYVTGLVREAELHQVVHAHRGRPGTRALTSLLTSGVHRTRSRPERDLAALCATARLPPPRLNQAIHGLEVDALWPEHRLVAEVDTLGTHGSAAAFTTDRRRDLTLQAAGIDVLRITDTQLTHDRPAVTATLAAALARRAPPEHAAGLPLAHPRL